MLTDIELMAQVLAVFREEQAEHRQAAAELLLKLEREPDHPQRQAKLDRLFRKGSTANPGLDQQAEHQRPNGRLATEHRTGVQLNAPTTDHRPLGAGNGELLREANNATVRLSTQVLDTLLNEAGELVTCTVGAQQQARAARDLAAIPARWRRIWRQTD